MSKPSNNKPQFNKNCLINFLRLDSKSNADNRVLVFILSLNCIDKSLNKYQLLHLSAMKESKDNNEIIIAKERQKQSDELILDQQINARRFFANKLVNMVKEARAPTEDQQFIFQLFLSANFIASKRRSKINIYCFGRLRNYEKEIKMMNQIEQLMQKEHQRKKRESSAITQISQLTHSNLKVISIKYDKLFDRYDHLVFPYSVSAFQLFKVVHINKLLTKVLIKGVEVLQFQQFIQLINPSHQGLKTELLQEQEYDWIHNFHPIKGLQLTLDCKLLFNLNQYPIFNQIKDLAYFGGLFHLISDLSMRIKLCRWDEIAYLSNELMALWALLSTINNIHIQVQGPGHYYIPDKEYANLRSLVLGGLTSLTQIAKLSLKDIHFNPHAHSRNDLLVTKQRLSTLFQSNNIIHLQLHDCSYLPISLQIYALELVSLKNVVTSKGYDFFNKSNCQLKIKYLILDKCNQDLRINEEVFNQLQALVIKNCRNVLIDVKTSQPSKIKHLHIAGLIHNDDETLLQFFSKLSYLSHLNLSGFNFSDKLLSMIPSSFVENLQISWNQSISDEAIRKIDQNWQKLKYLKLNNCQKITKNIWTMCRFERLMEIEADFELFGRSKKQLQLLKLRGIKMSYAP